jgi:hypothetical protein
MRTRQQIAGQLAAVYDGGVDCGQPWHRLVSSRGTALARTMRISPYHMAISSACGIRMRRNITSG